MHGFLTCVGEVQDAAAPALLEVIRRVTQLHAGTTCPNLAVAYANGVPTPVVHVLDFH